MKSCEDCGSRIYEYGCTWCNEVDYIEMKDYHDQSHYYVITEELDSLPKDAK